MRGPRSVTMAPMAMPSRTLNAAIDFLALVTTGFCPQISPRSRTSGSSILVFCVASPTPMFTTILCSRGTAIGLVAPSSLASAGAISLSNLSFSLAVTFVVAIASLFFLLPRFRSGYRFVGSSISWSSFLCTCGVLALLRFSGTDTLAFASSMAEILLTRMTAVLTAAAIYPTAHRNAGRSAHAGCHASCVQCATGRSSGTPP